MSDVFMFNVFEQLDKNEIKFTKKEIETKVAIIGISSRLPKSNNFRDFWGNLVNGVDCIGEIDSQRKKDCDYFFENKGIDTKKINYQQMAFVNDVDKFDYKYFNIPYQEASLMDPRQRLFLESSIHALLDAGYPEKKVNGSNIGVYVGSSNSDSIYNYDKVIYDSSIRNPVSIVNNLPSMIASRVSYYLDLKGPSMTLDTSCSSSLVAVHEACKAIIHNECEMAIAGGCNLNLIPLQHEVRLGIESSTFRTRAYDNDSDGTGFGEGIITFILKPLFSALRDNDNIYSVIEGSSVSNQGFSFGVATPSIEGQENLISENINKSNIDINDISFIEGHGTGTAIGDVIEIEAINRAFSEITKKNYLPMGSVKNNIGHLLSASGAAGLLKSVLALKNQMFPPTINYNTPNKNIDFSNSPVFINTEKVELHKKELLLGCISSFGMSGTNCHMIISNYYKKRTIPNEDCLVPQIFTFSANDLDTLTFLLSDLYNFLLEENLMLLSDIGYTLNCRRDHLANRVAIIASCKEDLLEKLKEALNKIQQGNKIIKDSEIYFNVSDITSNVKELSLGDESQDDLRQICRRYIMGGEISWDMYYKEHNQVVSLPVFTFKKTRCWYSEEKIDFVLNDDVILNEKEKIVVETWAKLFGLNKIDFSQDIYQVGGDSLSLVSMYHEIESKIPNISLEVFIEKETLNEILDYVNEASQKNNETDELIFEKNNCKVYKFSNGINNSNTYLICDRHKSILIDSGVSLEYLTEFCERLKLNRIDYIVLTHAHFDHTYSANEIKEKFNCNFIIHEREINFARDIINNGLALLGKSFTFESDDILIKDKYTVLNIGDISLKIILSPGHTTGSVCVLYDKLLFTGDTIFKDKKAKPDKKTGNEDYLKKSISYLINNTEDNTIICPGHEDIATISFVKKRIYDF
ncbi:beta-ketoacyl synthase N-terminal-like domain-containing protein [Bacillus amyloliquefaciens]|uniref:beta-ketoacyl synthase N-terminal-like domain-containing protein n=1 Tax=Bacillus amyloliquefaciens TaxID=1390 RepID=UPI00158076C9|nr:MBL fold metallo-hydrolase [Bacillus amyloliquefaciens]NUI32308.1 MBL fold metallo-hydrolase [Bacillus amyloliquefaciens]NUI35838.1 MBL fold metallo-hydrolase [Bacillus amyloliquefaciens]NUI70700.1 MBL fold metallo-hydrolase [Bacillus amyloliquefaciens]NUI73937.1 MBL fold metallo-hydrolase [Bacillus amyloliquefaciens]